MTDQFLDYFQHQITNTPPFRGYLSNMTREQQLESIRVMNERLWRNRLPDGEVEEFLDKKLAEHSPHIGDHRLQMVVQDTNELRVIHFWMSEADQLSDQYKFVNMATDTVPCFELKDATC